MDYIITTTPDEDLGLTAHIARINASRAAEDAGKTDMLGNPIPPRPPITTEAWVQSFAHTQLATLIQGQRDEEDRAIQQALRDPAKRDAIKAAAGL